MNSVLKYSTGVTETKCVAAGILREEFLLKLVRTFSGRVASIISTSAHRPRPSRYHCKRTSSRNHSGQRSRLPFVLPASRQIQPAASPSGLHHLRRNSSLCEKLSHSLRVSLKARLKVSLKVSLRVSLKVPPSIGHSQCEHCLHNCRGRVGPPLR